MILHDKLVKLMRSVGSIPKDGTNSFHKYKYTTVASLQKKVQAALIEQGLHLETTMELLSCEEGRAIVRVSAVISDGNERIAFQGLGEGTDKGDKSVPKAISNAVKYLWATGLCVAWVDYDDPEADSSVDSASDTFASLKAKLDAARSPDSLEDARKSVSAVVNKNELTQRQLTALKKLYEDRKKDFA